MHRFFDLNKKAPKSACGAFKLLLGFIFGSLLSILEYLLSVFYRKGLRDGSKTVVGPMFYTMFDYVGNIVDTFGVLFEPINEFRCVSVCRKYGCLLFLFVPCLAMKSEAFHFASKETTS